MKRSHLSADPTLRERFLHEARIASLIDSPNVVKVHDVGAFGESLYYAMEHAPGWPLLEVMELVAGMEVWPSLESMVELAAGALDGLAAVHEVTDERGESLVAVHRDVTPRNLILGVDGLVRLIDLGLGKSGLATWKTQQGAVMGTPGYLSPEQARGQPTDARSDLYVIGVILWELLALRPLIPRGGPLQMLEAAARLRVVPPSSLRPDVPAALDRAVLRALDVDPEARPASAREMKAEVLAAIPIVPGQAVRELLGGREPRPLAELGEEADEAGTVAYEGATDLIGFGEESLLAAVAAPTNLATVANRRDPVPKGTGVVPRGGIESEASPDWAPHGGDWIVFSNSRRRDVEDRPSPLRSGALFGRYRLLSRSSSVGLQTWIARTQGRKHPVLITIQDSSWAQGPIHGYPAHPNVAELLDAGRIGDRAFMVTERPALTSLAALCWMSARLGRRVSPLHAALVAADVAEAAGFVWSLPSRDQLSSRLSLHDIFVERDGVAKLFGLWPKQLEPATQTDEAKRRSASYLSPEEARGSEPDVRSSIFSVGIVLQELCAGRRLFKHEDHAEILRMLADGVGPPWEVEGLDPKLQSVIGRCLARDPNDRFQSATALVADLFACVDKPSDERTALVGWVMDLLSADRPAADRAQSVSAALVRRSAPPVAAVGLGIGSSAPPVPPVAVGLGSRSSAPPARTAPPPPVAAVEFGSPSSTPGASERKRAVALETHTKPNFVLLGFIFLGMCTIILLLLLLIVLG
ncbi:MAG: protein kinase [Deltaproteobacteria bacterium]|nr:protein kinase [Deltaproteobacteria bacterium]